MAVKMRARLPKKFIPKVMMLSWPAATAPQQPPGG
jgi:hypothetical protein